MSVGITNGAVVVPADAGDVFGDVGVVEADPLAWRADALCAQTDPEAFFPDKGGSTRDAKRICGECDVRAQCLEWALEHDERFGIWGGTSERERRKLRAGRPAVVEPVPFCKRGHDLNDPANVQVWSGRRNCRECARLRRERKAA